MNMTATTSARSPAWKAPVPSFFDPKNASKWNYRPNVGAIFTEGVSWRKNVPAAIKDSKKVQLLLIDVQKDFCFSEGTLYVGGRSGTGAIDDSARIAEFIYRNLNYVTGIAATLDTHIPYQIFFPSFWEKADGTPVAPNTIITVKDLDQGTYRVALQAAAAVQVDYMWLTKYVRHYCATLEAAGKYSLFIWPYHCMLGTDGHTLVGVVDEACNFHAFARGAKFNLEVKGGNPLTENYSVLSPEVLSSPDGKWQTQKNARFIQTLLDADRVIIAGQAASHCVKSTIDDLLSEIAAKDPSLAKKVYIMRDCMSAVVIPGVIDFTDQAEDALKKFEAAGMHVVDSTDDMSQWPDF